MAQSKAGRRFMFTKFRNGGRKAGAGVAYDDYSEESGNKCYEASRPLVRFSTDGRDPKSLNGPVIIAELGEHESSTSFTLCHGDPPHHLPS